MAATTTQLPGYIAGTWRLDPAHSEVSFTARHLMVSKVRGYFRHFDLDLVTAEDPLESTVSVTIDTGSVDTGNPDRDAHVRGTDFLDAERYPTMTYRSTGIRTDGDHFLVDGDLTLHGVTRSVPLQLEVNGFQPATPFGDTRVGFSATAEINRRDFGVEFNMPIEGGGVVVGDRIQVSIEIEAILAS